MDTGEWDALDEVFTADAVIDYTSVGGPRTPAVVKPWLEKLPGFDRLAAPVGQVESEVRRATTATGDGVLPQPDGGVKAPDGTEMLVEFGGNYHHDLVRTPDGWRSRGMVDEIIWQRGF